MSLNTAHINGGVLIHSGECILIYANKVALEWKNESDPTFKGTKNGRIYLTTHRMIFNANSSSEKMQSFSFPFVTLSNMQLEQPIFGANYIRGTVVAQPNGNWQGTNEFKLTFKNGGAIEFGQAMLKAANLATRSYQNQGPPPYSPPNTQWYAAPPPAYAPAPTGYYGWQPPPNNTFPDAPPQNTVFMTDAPPPYPGLAGSGGYHGQPQGAAGMHQNPAAFAKAQEAAQSAYYDPNQPQMAYVPPPAYYETPPSYEQATHKKDQ